MIHNIYNYIERRNIFVGFYISAMILIKLIFLTSLISDHLITFFVAIFISIARILYCNLQ